MRIDVITLFPEMIQALTSFGVVGRAIEKGLLRLRCWNPRDFTCDTHRTVDDRPYGGGPGMVMKVEPLQKAIHAARQDIDDIDVKTWFLSPQGHRLQQAEINRLSRQDHLILLAGRYEGVDERLIELEVDEEWSIGDYVLSGGELAALVLIDATSRVIPGVLGDEESALQDSFMLGLLDHPHYTRPQRYERKSVPEVLLTGNHEEIRRWRLKQALGRTWQRRPDLIQQFPLEKEQQALLDEFKRDYNSRPDRR